MACATMIQRAIWLSHTAVPERERASLIQGPLAPDGLFGPRFSEPGGCRVAVGRRVHMASGSPASKKRRPLEPRGRTRDSLHEPVDTAACTGLLVPHIIPSTVQQFVEGEETCPCAVATACGQRTDTGAAGSPPVQRARARRLDSSLFLQRLVLVRLLRSLSLLPFMGSPPWFTHSVEAVGAEEYGLFLDGLPQLLARPLSDHCVLARAVRSTIVVGQHVEMGPSHTVQASSLTLLGVGGDHATGPGCEHGSGSRVVLTGVQQEYIDRAPLAASP
ncbi:unnamed protein product [Boreogadus saida]